MNITKDKIIKLFISILLIQLPFLDMLRTTSFRHFEVLGISFIELVNIFLIGFALLVTIIKLWENKKKNILFLILYLVLVFMYIFLHYKHIITFDKTIFPKANFNLITETFYILRVYVLPLMLLYVLCNNKDLFNKEYYLKIAKIVIGIISGFIIVLNILKLSFISYSSTKNFISHNIFDYFLFSGDFRQLTSRGWFDSANELSATMFMLMPINIYIFYKNPTRKNLILFISQFLAMILLGTRTAAYGSVIISITSLVIYIALVLLQKEKRKPYFEKYMPIFTLILSAFMTISPFMISRISEGTPDFSVKNSDAYSSLSKVDKKDKKSINKIFEKYKDEYLINEAYLKMYPFSNDTEFWLQMASRDKSLNNNSRIMKTDIIKRIKERNNNKLDTYFGLGYTLNFMDLERDYVYQYYLFGIVGMTILMGPYFIFLIYLAIIALKNIKNNLRYSVILGFMSTVLGLAIAYLSGHVFGWVSPMMYLVFTLAFLNITVYARGDLNEK